MKNKIFLVIILAIVLIANSCKKDITTDGGNNNTNVQTFQSDGPITTNPEQDKALKDKILSFKQQLTAPKSNKILEELVDITDAKQMMEALLNYDFTEMNHAFPAYRLDTVAVLVPTNGSEITIEELSAVYDHINAEVIAILGSGGEVEIGSITLIPRAMTADDILPIDVILNLGFYPNSVVFNTTNQDYWYWGKKLGKLNGDYAGVYDATSALTSACNQTLNNIYGLNDYYFDNFQGVTKDHIDALEINDPVYTSRIWWKDQLASAPEPYLTPAEMNFYMNQILYLAQYYKPAGLTIQNVSVSYLETTQTLNPGTINMAHKKHSIYVTYGIPHHK